MTASGVIAGPGALARFRDRRRHAEPLVVDWTKDLIGGGSGAVFNGERTHRYQLQEGCRSDVVGAAIKAADRDTVAVLPESQLKILRAVVHLVAVDVMDGFGADVAEERKLPLGSL